MLTTIDKSGKLQIPEGIRERLGITQQTTLDIEEAPGQIVIKVVHNKSQLIDKDGVLVFCGLCKDDPAQLINQDRDMRIAKISSR